MPNQYTFTLKMATEMFAKTLDNLQHFTRLWRGSSLKAEVVGYNKNILFPFLLWIENQRFKNDKVNDINYTVKLGYNECSGTNYFCSL
jgi:hypothetical protein